MSQSWQERNDAWEGRARRLGERAVLHVGHSSPEAQAAIWDKQRMVIMPLLRDAITHIHTDNPPLILDFGCGVGRWSGELSELGLVVGVDPTVTFLETCERRWGNTPGITFKHYEDGNIPAADNTFDVVFACMVLSTILDVKDGMFTETLIELKRVLRKGGLFFLVDNTEGHGGRPVRSPYSISRTVKEYQDAAAEHMNVALSVFGRYEDLGETNTIFAGRRLL